MDMVDLPWWREFYSKDSRRNLEGFMQVLSKNVFEERLKNFPLSIEIMGFFIKNYVDKINLKESDYSKGRCSLNSSYSKFVIQINPNQSFDEKGVTLIHESMHCIYRALGMGIFSKDGKERIRNRQMAETIIENYSQDFYYRNKKFVKPLLEKYLIS